jgi:hypothetical protein
MSRWWRLPLFLSGLFFGGGLDHLLFILLESPTSHYGLRIGVAGQMGFAALDLSVAALLYLLHVRWSRASAIA